MLKAEKQGQGSGNEGGLNPLLIDIVASKLFEHLSLKQLVQCRLVCKSWCQNGRLKMLIRDKAVVNLRNVYLHSSTTVDNLENFFEIGGPIYTHYHFENISYANAFVSQFLKVFGPTIEILKLHLDLNQMNVSQFRELIYEHLPNLKELNIYNLSHEEVFLKPLFLENCPPLHTNIVKLELQEIRSPIVNFMSDLMSSLPNLREIVLKVDVCSDWSEQSEMWRQNSSIATSVMQGLLNSGAFKTLQEFRCGKLRVDHIAYLLEMGLCGLRLTTLELHAPSKDAEETFTAFLQTQCNSLQELIIFEQRSPRYRKKIEDDENFVLRIPDKMHKLEVLQLSKYPKSVMVPMYPVDYTQQCPSLKRLLLIGHYGNLFIPSKKCSSVSEVALWEKVRDVDTASVLSSSFSNLTKLHVRYPVSGFLTALWQECNKLEILILTLEESVYMDEAITGISEAEILKWLQSRKSKLEAVEEPVSGAGLQKSILNLNDLRTLKVTVDHDEKSDRQSICEVTAYFALRKMNSLKYLELLSSDWQMGLTNCLFFTTECQDLLRKELSFTTIRFSPG